MDVTLIKPFVDATLNVLETMAFTKAQAGKPYLKTDEVAHGDVSGVLGLTGEGKGTISVSFSEECILPIVSNMLGEKMDAMTDDIKDAVGEITNMIAGQARMKLDQMGKKLKAAIPTVIVGQNHTITHMTQQPVMAIPFNTDNGAAFTIEVSFGE